MVQKLDFIKGSFLLDPTFFLCAFARMRPFSSELVIGLLAIALNYGTTFKLPTTSLLKDPVQTLSTTVPVLFFGHILLVALSHALRGTWSKAIVSLKTIYIENISCIVLIVWKLEISGLEYISYLDSNGCFTRIDGIVRSTFNRVTYNI